VRNLLTAIVVIPLAGILILLAVANRTPVTLSLDPFTPEVSAYSIQLPLFLVILLAIMLGVVVGGIADWVRQGRYRREARHGRSEVRRLEKEAAELRRSSGNADNLPAPYMRGNGR
jgi:uncharacterized integral membrane protein